MDGFSTGRARDGGFVAAGFGAREENTGYGDEAGAEAWGKGNLCLVRSLEYHEVFVNSERGCVGSTFGGWICAPVGGAGLITMHVVAKS